MMPPSTRPDVASAANISAFTLGSALGITLGGAAIDGGLGLASVNWIGGLLTTSGLLVAVLTWALFDRGTGTVEAVSHHGSDHHGQHAAHQAVVGLHLDAQLGCQLVLAGRRVVGKEQVEEA